MADTTEMNTLIETVVAPKRRLALKKPVEAPPAEVEAPPLLEAEAEAEAEAPPKKQATFPITVGEWKRLKAVEKEYNEMKAKYDEMVAKETALKAKRNEASKKSKAKKTKETKEVKAKLEVRVEALEKAMLKSGGGSVAEELDEEECKTEGCDNNGEENGFCEECNAEHE